jgi:hypothetical protein
MTSSSPLSSSSVLSPTEQAFLDNPELFSNKKQRYLRYRIRKKLTVAAQQQRRGNNYNYNNDSALVAQLAEGGFASLSST